MSNFISKILQPIQTKHLFLLDVRETVVVGVDLLVISFTG